jgi:ABC-type transport system substrate-binding protein
MSHFWHKPLSIAASLAFVAGMMGFGAAGVSAHGTHSASSTHRAAKGTLIFSDYEAPTTPNPIQLTVVVELAMANEILPFGETPFYNQKVKLQSGFFTKLSGSGKTYSTSIRKGIKWSNGHPVTNNDLIFGWKIYMNLGFCSGFCDDIASISKHGSLGVTFHLHSPTATFWALDVPPFIPSFVAKAPIKSVASGSQIKACLNSKGPNADLGFTACGAADKTISTDPSFNYQNSDYLTAGPYQISSWGGSPLRVTFKPMKYWKNSNVGTCCVKGGGKGGPRLKTLVFQAYANQTGMEAAAATGATDVTSDYTVADVKTLDKLNSHHKYHVAVPGTFNLEMMFFNVYGKKVDVRDNANHTVYSGANPVANVKVRQALALAFNRAGLISFAYKTSKSVASKLVSYSVPVPNDTSSPKDPWGDKKINGAWDPLKHKYVAPATKSAMADAKKLLKQAGYSSKHKAQIYITTNSVGNLTRASEQLYLQKSWGKLGSVSVHNVDVEERGNPAPFLATWSQSGTTAHGHTMIAIFEEALGAPQPDGWEPDVASNRCPRTEKDKSKLDTDANWSCIKNKTIDTIFKKAAKTTNNGTRIKLFDQFQTLMVNNVYWDALAMKPNVETYDGKAVNILPSAFSSGTPNWDSWDWAAKS